VEGSVKILGYAIVGFTGKVQEHWHTEPAFTISQWDKWAPNHAPHRVVPMVGMEDAKQAVEEVARSRATGALIESLAHGEGEYKQATCEVVADLYKSLTGKEIEESEPEASRG
jgi:hypothetical protein